VDVFFHVSFEDPALSGAKGPAKKDGKQGANLAGVKVGNVDTKSTVAIARELRERAERLRTRGDADTVRASAKLAAIPAPLVGAATRLSAFLSYDLGLNLSRLGIPQDPFGSCMVTNVGVFGITVAWAPLIHMSRVPLVLTLGAVHDAPMAHDGAVVVRKVATVGVAFDHRVMDGYHAGKMARTLMAAMADPEGALGPA
jgi:hypothetical protein